VREKDISKANELFELSGSSAVKICWRSNESKLKKKEPFQNPILGRMDMTTDARVEETRGIHTKVGRPEKPARKP